MTLKAGVVQFSPLYGRVVDNLERLERLVESAVAQGARLLVLPEMAWTGYLWANEASVRAVAEPLGSGPGQDRVFGWARRWGITLVYGFPEREGERIFNSQGVANPDGVPLPVYRKTHLFEADEWWTVPGQTGYQLWNTPCGRVGSGICMDLNFPDLVEHHVAANTDVLAFSTNWLDQGADVIPYWEDKLLGTEGRAFKGLALFANRGGAEFGVPFRGQSCIFRGGRCVASVPGTDDAVLVEPVST